jgi:hypothetical protein
LRRSKNRWIDTLREILPIHFRSGPAVPCILSNMNAKSGEMDVLFGWGGETGSVHIECIPNADPDFWGCWSSVAEGFPVCTALVEYPALGYRSMFGWVQLVRSTDNDSAGEHFEVDPLALFGDAPSPYCWYGQRPVLFDAPSRTTRRPLEWVAHSFLATTPLREVAAWKPRRVVPLVGFSWGFRDSGSSVELHETALLSSDDWQSHLDALRATYPAWVFSEAKGGQLGFSVPNGMGR